MMDERTKSWWQQVSGKAILGPLRGEKLDATIYEELTFATWKKEAPHGRVLIPDAEISRANEYAKADWEKEMAHVPVTSAFFHGSQASARTIVIGLNLNGVAKAYPQSLLTPFNPVNDTVSGNPIVLITNQDGKSIRCFLSRVDGRRLEFFVRPGTKLRWFDSETGTEWDFSGNAIDGQWKGRQLQKLPILKDYWFDWKTYHPQTGFYSVTPKRSF